MTCSTKGEPSAFRLLLPYSRDFAVPGIPGGDVSWRLAAVYPPWSAQVAGTEDGEERVGKDAEHQLGEAVARGVAFPQRERSRRIGAAQLGQEPLHRQRHRVKAEGDRVPHTVPSQAPPLARTAPHFRLALGPAHSCGTSGAG